MLPGAAGCVIAPPHTDPGADIRDALGLEQAVEFHMQGFELDEPLEGRHLSEALAVQRAVETSPELQGALARVRVAEKDADLMGRLPNPILSLVLLQPTGGGMTQFEASLTENLLGMLERPQRATMAGHRLQAEAAAALSAALDVVADVQSSYAQCQVLEERVRVLEGRLAGFDQLVEAQSEPAGAERREPMAFDVERLELSIELEGRQRDLRLARLALARRIGQPSSAADWALDPWSAPPAVPADEAACLENALASRPEIVALECELRAREEEEALASGVPWEGLLLGVKAEEDEHGEETVGPKVKTPLPVFDTPEGHRERARFHSSEVRHQLAEVRRSVVEEVRGALWVLQSAQASLVRVESELLPAQERRYAEAERGFLAGQADGSELLLAQAALGRAQDSRLRLVAEVSAAFHALQRAVGGPVRFSALNEPPPAPAPAMAPTSTSDQDPQ